MSGQNGKSSSLPTVVQTTAAPVMVPATISDGGPIDFVEQPHAPTVNVFHVVHSALRGRYWIAIILGLAGAVGGAWLGYHAKPVKYQSEVVLRFKPTTPHVIKGDEQTNVMPMFDAYVDAQAAMIDSQRIIGDALQDPSWRALRPVYNDQVQEAFTENLTVTHQRSSEIVQVAFTDEIPDVAEAGVGAISETYKKFHSEEDSDSQSLATALEGHLRDLNGKITANESSISGIESDNGSTDLERIYESKLSQIELLESRINDKQIEIAETPDGNSSTTAPSPEARAISPRDSVQYANLLLEESNMEMDLAGQHTELGDENPKLKGLQARLDIVKKQIQNFGDTMSTTMPSGLQQSTFKTKAQLTAELKEITSIHDQLNAETKKLGVACGQLESFRREDDQLKSERSDTQDTIDRLNMDTSLGGQLVDYGRPDKPLAPVQDKRAMLAVVGGMGLGGLGVGLVFLIGLIDRRVRHISDVADALAPGKRILGVLPHLPDDMSDPAQAELAAQSVHQVRTLLQHRRSAGEKTVLTITSPSAGAGKTSLSVALGLSYAASGSNTLLIDCDIIGGGLTARLKKMTHRRLGRILRIQGLITTEQLRAAILESHQAGRRVGETLVNMGLVTKEQIDTALSMQEKMTVGLREALHGEPLGECLAFSGTPRLWIMPLGSAERKHVSELTYAALVRILIQARTKFDVIILDTGPILASLEGLVAAMVADEVVLTVARGEQRPAVGRAMKYLASNGASFAGIVLNRADAQDMASSGHSSSYSRYSRSDSAAPEEPWNPVDHKWLKLGPVGQAVATLTDCGETITKAPDDAQEKSAS